jgi:hypothetical protein
VCVSLTALLLSGNLCVSLTPFSLSLSLARSIANENDNVVYAVLFVCKEGYPEKLGRADLRGGGGGGEGVTDHQENDRGRLHRQRDPRAQPDRPRSRLRDRVLQEAWPALRRLSDCAPRTGYQGLGRQIRRG